MLIEIDPIYIQQRRIIGLVDALRRGKIIIYPTDTTYGFACKYDDLKAINAILKIKQMPKEKLLSLICPSLKDASQYAHISNTSFKLLKHCLPGPYTFILKATDAVPRKMMTKRKTIGIRIPDNKIAKAIVEELGEPMITASVRLGNDDLPMSDPDEIEQRLGHAVEAIVDAGIIVPQESSVVDLSEEPPVILREGAGDLSFFTQV